ncbi:MAG: hypothetical protein AAFQ22_07115 [Pseudomonadota bacterium]
MINEDWVRLYEGCRLAQEDALARIGLWEEWVAAERRAQAEVNNGT